MYVLFNVLATLLQWSHCLRLQSSLQSSFYPCGTETFCMVWTKFFFFFIHSCSHTIGSCCTLLPYSYIIEILYFYLNIYTEPKL